MLDLPEDRFDEKDAAALGRYVDELREIHRGSLVAVAVTGEAASSTYRAGQTPLQSVVVLEEVTPVALRASRPALRRWARRRIPTPLFLDPAYLASALDSFPLEFLEIAEHHVLLHGDASLFESIQIDPAHLRLEVEEQLRGKMLHLWEAYLEHGGRRRDLERLLQDPLPGFAVALRGLIRLREGNGKAGERLRREGVELIDAVASELALELPTFRRLEAARTAGSGLASAELESLFESFLSELRGIVRVIDALAGASGSHGA
ncbi:MAG: hypothetical protein JRG86_05175 [Deltaproteobacteria bacterium]|jgi:hypothetical protein|nr:hypothetical protein [Deltaproteobacteria bacterium]